MTPAAVDAAEVWQVAAALGLGRTPPPVPDGGTSTAVGSSDDLLAQRVAASKGLAPPPVAAPVGADGTNLLNALRV